MIGSIAVLLLLTLTVMAYIFQPFLGSPHHSGDGSADDIVKRSAEELETALEEDVTRKLNELT